MRRKSYWKRIAAVLMTTVMLLQVQAVTAAEETQETQAAVQTELLKEKVSATEAPATEVPATEAPATEAPATEAPVTEAPATEAPATEAPATEAPATEAPATEAPETEAPATEAPVTEAPATEAPETEAPVTEAPATEAPETEAPETEETEEKAEETEAPVYKTDFYYEDGEVVITAKAGEAAKLPENTELRAEKLVPGSAAYEQAKSAAKASLGVDDKAAYTFYDVTFYVNGQKVEVPQGTVTIQIQFKTVQADSTAEKQSVLHIDANSVQDVTAPSASGCNMCSVDFAF